MEAQLAEVDRKRDELAKLQEKPERPFFLWHLFFQDVFAQGGFDIAIANPPYVRQEVIKNLKPALKAAGYECYNGMADLYIYFYELSVRCLRPSGTLCYISSNSVLNSDFGLLLRRKFLAETTLTHILDFAEAPVFKAVTEPVIIGLKKSKPGSEAVVSVLKWNEDWPIDRVQERIAAAGTGMKQSELSPEVWRLESPAVLNLLDKVRKRHKPLGKIVGDRFYYGIKTGMNDAFIIDRAQRDALIAEHASSRRLIQPFLRGKDIKKWQPVFSENYLIRIESSSNKTHPWSNHPADEAERIFAREYPAVFRWLNGFRSKLISRDDQGMYFWELRACAYWSEFNESKIIYQEINRTDVFAYDEQGYLANNKVFILPGATKATLALLNSRFGIWFIHAFSGVPLGGFRRARSC